jgi:hypothetical protein
MDMVKYSSIRDEGLDLFLNYLEPLLQELPSPLPSTSASQLPLELSSDSLTLKPTTSNSAGQY